MSPFHGRKVDQTAFLNSNGDDHFIESLFPFLIFGLLTQLTPEIFSIVVIFFSF